MSARARTTQAAPDEVHYERHRAAVLSLLRARFGSALNEVDRMSLHVPSMRYSTRLSALYGRRMALA